MTPAFQHKSEINPDVAAAITILNGTPSNGNRIAFYRALKNGWLFLGAQSIPAEWANASGPVTIKQATSVSILTSSAPDGGQALLAFTSPKEVVKRNLQASFFAMELRSILEMVVQDGHSGLIINPSGPWAGVPKEDVQKILQGAW